LTSAFSTLAANPAPGQIKRVFHRGDRGQSRIEPEMPTAALHPGGGCEEALGRDPWDR
jgi:hypothetical protein